MGVLGYLRWPCGSPVSLNGSFGVLAARHLGYSRTLSAEFVFLRLWSQFEIKCGSFKIIIFLTVSPLIFF